MAAKRDYYEVLGVTKSSAADEIKQQYRKMALKFHPDRNKSSEAAEHFKEISEAYAVLSDNEKRQVYDQHGHAGVDGRYSSEDIFQGAGGGGRGFDTIFESIFGGGGFGSRRQQGSDILYETVVTLNEVLNGKDIKLNLNKQVKCNACNGSGAKAGTSKKTCTKCNGSGQLRQSRNMGFASFVTTVQCSACKAQGSIIEVPCNECSGQGSKQGRKEVNFKIPPGVESGNYTIQGEGNEIPDGVNGDLIVRVMVQQHPKFKRDGRDIFYDQEISMIDAALGCQIIVPTLENTEKIKIESGCQPNTVIKLKGKGVPHINYRGKGDQYIKITIKIPSKLSKHQKNLLDEFRKAG